MSKESKSCIRIFFLNLCSKLQAVKSPIDKLLYQLSCGYKKLEFENTALFKLPATLSGFPAEAAGELGLHDNGAGESEPVAGGAHKTVDYYKVICEPCLTKYIQDICPQNHLIKFSLFSMGSFSLGINFW